MKVNGRVVTATVGVPLTSPVLVSVRPAGRVPSANDQLYGAVPPVAARVWEYGTPTWPIGKEVVRIVIAAGAIVMNKVEVAVAAGDAESVTLNVIGLLETAAVGVPLIVPVDPIVSPGGNTPAVIDQE